MPEFVTQATDPYTATCGDFGTYRNSCGSAHSRRAYGLRRAELCNLEVKTIGRLSDDWALIASERRSPQKRIMYKPV
jgi:hypothetical protein